METQYEPKPEFAYDEREEATYIPADHRLNVTQEAADAIHIADGDALADYDKHGSPSIDIHVHQYKHLETALKRIVMRFRRMARPSTNALAFKFDEV